MMRNYMEGGIVCMSLATQVADYSRAAHGSIDHILAGYRRMYSRPLILGATALGAGAALYGPEWAGGPSEADINTGDKHKLRRAFGNALAMSGTVGALSTAPDALWSVATHPDKIQKARSALALGVSAVTAGTLANDYANTGEISLKNVAENTRHLRNAGYAIDIGSIPIDMWHGISGGEFGYWPTPGNIRRFYNAGNEQD